MQHVLIADRVSHFHRSLSAYRKRKDAPRSPRHAISPRSSSIDRAGLTWTGSDDFSDLRDRVDAAPLPLPPVDHPTRVVVVRHGQSTWNAAGRVQGSSNLGVLTEKGQQQARDTQKIVSCDAAD